MSRLHNSNLEVDIFKNFFRAPDSSVTLRPKSKLMWARWAHIALLVSYNDPDAFAVALWQQVEAIFRFPAASECITQHKNTEITAIIFWQTLTTCEIHNWCFLRDHSTVLGFKMTTLVHHIICWHVNIQTHAYTRYHRNTHVLVIVLSGTAGELRHHGNCCGRKH